jgi:hypothetical protein
MGYLLSCPQYIYPRTKTQEIIILPVLHVGANFGFSLCKNITLKSLFENKELGKLFGPQDTD